MASRTINKRTYSTKSISRAAAIARWRQLMALEPQTPAELRRFVAKAFGFRVPSQAIVPGHQSPMDYLVFSFFEPPPLNSPPPTPPIPLPQSSPNTFGGKKIGQQEPSRFPHETALANGSPDSLFSGGGHNGLDLGREESKKTLLTSGGQHGLCLGRGHKGTDFRGGGGDCVVWANRGGGKTMLGAIATLLDMIFKPGIQIRILGGSLEQSSRMYRYLLKLLDQPMLAGLLSGRPTSRRLKLVNQSEVEILAQSQKSVRGVRVHKLRCDEVEEFDPAIWQAAQMVTQSAVLGGRPVVGSVHALSTMHRPFGLMSRLVVGDQPIGPVFQWGALDVAERCSPDRVCDDCPIHRDCQGRAKTSDGFMKIDDLIAMHRRSSSETWQAEMLCLRPRLSDSVYPNFDPQLHVCPSPKPDCLSQSPTDWQWIGGMDFGLRCPLVMLWALVQIRQGQSPEQWPVYVVGEHVESDITLWQHLACLSERPWPKPAWIGVDPAGHQRNAQSGLSDVQILQKQGYRIRSMRQPIVSGIERIRRRLDQNLLSIDPACGKLIQAITLYHFDPQNRQNDQPVKDGPDHACDALRYMLTNLECGSSPVRVRHW